MTERGGAVRLRQAVLVAAELEPLAATIRSTLGLREPFRDPGVKEFGLVNAVFAIGDCFLEIVSPARAGTAASRQLERNGGDGGYMVLFDLEDLDGARARAGALGVRTVWQIDLPDISGTHMHPSDLRGAIVSLDSSRPYGSWRWGGPEWAGAANSDPGRPPGELRGITVAVAEPQAVAARWGEVLGVAPAGAERAVLSLGGAEVRFRSAAESGPEGIVEIAVALPPEVRGGRDEIVAGSARVALTDLSR
ncbi:MAG: VOC family protein [Solirubrobacteraceae bacterium]